MTDPLKFGAPLRRSLAGFFKLRIGNYRIIYHVKKSEVIVLVIAIGHRRQVYEEWESLFTPEFQQSIKIRFQCKLKNVENMPSQEIGIRPV